ncbi:MAG: hypothetical protein LC776_06180 [Acidobacteria bacterium]|nr:hypothetical protein [Acidobacteriota bacterium]
MHEKILIAIEGQFVFSEPHVIMAVLTEEHPRTGSLTTIREFARWVDIWKLENVTNILKLADDVTKVD